MGQRDVKDNMTIYIYYKHQPNVSKCMYIPHMDPMGVK